MQAPYSSTTLAGMAKAAPPSAADVPAQIRDGRMHTLAWDVAPGDALLIHAYTLHGADGNVSGAGRRIPTA